MKILIRIERILKLEHIKNTAKLFGDLTKLPTYSECRKQFGKLLSARYSNYLSDIKDNLIRCPLKCRSYMLWIKKGKCPAGMHYYNDLSSDENTPSRSHFVNLKTILSQDRPDPTRPGPIHI